MSETQDLHNQILGLSHQSQAQRSIIDEQMQQNIVLRSNVSLTQNFANSLQENLKLMQDANAQLLQQIEEMKVKMTFLEQENNSLKLPPAPVEAAVEPTAEVAAEPVADAA